MSSTLLIAQYTYELDKTTRFERLRAEDGLSSEYMLCIHQDKYGFIWTGAVIGLNMYDGYEFNVFDADPKNPRSLFNNSILCIYEEPDGTMWFGTELGISKYNRADQTFSNYIPDTLDLHNVRNQVRNIVQDGEYLWVDAANELFRFNKQTGDFRSFAKDSLNPSKGIHGINSDYLFMDVSGVLWVGSVKVSGDFILDRYDKQSETFVVFQNDPSDPGSFAGKKVMSMAEDHEGTIWVATWGGGLLEMTDPRKGIFRQYVHNENDTNSIIHNNLYKVFADSKGNIWTGGYNGLSLLNKRTGRFTNYAIPDQWCNPWRRNIISDIHEDYNGELWINIWEGLFRFNPTTKVLSHYLNDPETLSSLSNNSIRQVINDRTGQVWLIMRNNGINRINPFSNTFRIIQKKANVPSSLSRNSINRFFTDSRGNFWVGCNVDGGLNRMKMNRQKVFENFEHFAFDADDPKSLSGNQINDIFEDRDQMLWFSTWDGLNRYDYQTNSFTRYQHNPLDNKTISSDDIESIFEDSQGTFWIGTRHGLNIMDRQTGNFIRFLPDENDKSGISNLDIRVIFEDSYNDLWFGGDYLEKLNRKDTSFIGYLPDTRNLIDIYRTEVWEIEEDDSTNLWMSSGLGGVYKLDRNTMTFSALTIEHGLPSNDIETLEIDNNGDIWAGTNQGLARINPKNLEIKSFNVADGLVNLELMSKSLYKDADGWLYVGGRDGFNVFHPDSLKENTIIPPVYITSLTVAGEPKYFDKPLYELSAIDLQYHENDFSFDFVAINYINSQKNQYAYMLEGYDEDWIYSGNRRTAYYTNLSPGKYTFRVKGSNNDGYWNEDGASLAMVIYPPFWKTWWAYVLYAVAFIVLVYVLRRNELRKIYLRQELEMKQVQAEQLAELDVEKNKFFSNISHEFRTPLTLILGPLERLIGNPKDENQKDQLNLIRRNARRLQVLINQLLSLSKLESGKMKLKARPEDIVKLTRLFLESFHSMAQDKGIRLDFDSDVETCIVYVDPGKFEKVANNLLSNAFKFTERGDKIKVSISATHEGAGGVAIKFSDTGLGIKKEDLSHVFDRFYQVDEKQMKTNLGTGIGLALTKELVELHHGTITAESEPGMGTTFTLSLPVGTYHLSSDEIVEPGAQGSQTEDELLNDDYLFVEDGPAKTDLQTEVPANSDLPLILIVEDNDDMRSYIKSYLVDSYTIIEAANGREGADQAIDRIPDLIVSDLMMPKMDGNEMTLLLKTDERTSHIPIILLTAKASKESKLEGLETGADDFLSKPFDADELLVRIKNLIEQRKKLRTFLSKHVSDTGQSRLFQTLTSIGMSRVDEKFLEKAREHIHAHMSDPDFSVEVFAGKMGMGRVQLHRKIKSLIDHSPSDLIRDLRLTKAAELLKKGELNVTQVSYEIGMSSLSNFAKSFKEKYGVNPSEYV